MNRKMQLRQRRADLVKEQKGIFEAAEKESRALSDAEKSRDDAIAAELETIAGDLARIERQEAAELAANAAGAIDDRAAQRTATERNAGFNSLADFAVAVYRASNPADRRVDARLEAMFQAAPSNFHREGGSDGEGYMVPPEYRDRIWELVIAEEGILARVAPEPTSRNQVTLDADESTPWGATGVQARWRSEGAQMTASKLTTDPRYLTLHELYAFVTATEELLEDAPRLNNRLMNAAPRAIRWKADDAIIWGNGVGRPRGWMNGPGLVTVAKESGQTADTIVVKNVIKMFSRMLGDGIGRAFWLTNSDTLPELMTLVVGDRPVWMPPAGLAAAPGGTLLGRPVLLSEHAKTLGDLGDIQLADPMGYYAANKSSGITLAESIHLYFDYNMKAFRWTFRLGGQPLLSAPVSPANGAATKSHFVALAERA